MNCQHKKTKSDANGTVECQDCREILQDMSGAGDEDR